MTKYALPQIQELSPYNPPLGGRRETNSLLLNFNERTVPVPVKVTEALTAMLIDNKVQIYPEYGDLCNKIGDYCGVKNSEVMITNGSGQGIDLIFRTFTKKGDKVVIPSPSFALFYQCAKVVGNEIITPEYTFEKGFPFEETLESIRDGVKLIVLCNPNNPTGTLVSLEEIEMIVSTAREAGTVVIVDEAYFEFSKVTAVDLIKKFVVDEKKVVLGICNGFQVLIKLGILPGFDENYEDQNSSLALNDSGRYEDRWVNLKFNSESNCIATKGIDEMYIPVRHGEGKIIANDDVMEKIMDNNQYIAQYINPETKKIAVKYPINPNGSTNAIAGLSDETGRIFGLMPHPEANLLFENHPHWTRLKRDYEDKGMKIPEHGDGLKIFKNIVEYLEGVKK